MAEKRIYLTTPIYYVNSSPHLGHAYTTILCDVVRRYYRLLGYETYFLTGTDEHGTTNWQAAAKNGETPQAFVDRMSRRFRDLWPQLSIVHDDFIRTTEERHKKVVRRILQDLFDRGEIYFEKYGGHYCSGCERFYTEKELAQTGGRCPDHRVKPTWIEEENYFFRMSKYQDWLIDYIRSHPELIRPERYRNEILSFLSEPLRDLCISRPRSRLPWGIPLPFDENYVTYVWFDALVNYLSALDYPDGDKFKRFWPAVEHFIAKDIVKTHAVYWPTMLRAMGADCFRRLNVHGYWNMGGLKMSKSLGNVAAPLDLVNIYGVDGLRYFLMREMVFGLDASFDERLFNERYNSNLADDLGNLISRLTAMIGRYCEGLMPPSHTLERADQAVLALIEAVIQTMPQWLADLKFHQIIEESLQAVRSLNRYVNDNEPWALAKAGKRERLETVLHVATRGAVMAIQLLAPVMPAKMAEALSWLGIEEMGESIDLNPLRVGAAVVSGGVLFPKVRLPGPEEEKKAAEPQPKPAKKKEPEMAEISFEEFAKVDLRVARVLEAERVKGTDKLMQLKIDVGGEPRTIVAGIAHCYKPEDLIGHLIVVVANLAPRTLRGVTSHGMLLAAVEGASLRLVIPDGDIPPGTKIS